MKYIVFAILWFSLLLSRGAATIAWPQATPDQPPRVKLYVGKLTGDEDLVKQVRDHLVDELGKRRVALSPSAEEADVVLNGSGIQQVGTRFVVRSKTTVLIATRGEIQLSTRDGRNLWCRDISSTRWAVSQTQSFAEAAARQIEPLLRQIATRILASP